MAIATPDDSDDGDGTELTANVSEDADPPASVAQNPILYDQIWSRMHEENDNWMGAVVGETGSGKSYAALRLCEAVDPTFSIDRVAWDVIEFLQLVNDDSIPRGGLILFEEASVELAALDFQSKENRFARQVADTWREQNRGAVFTLPAFKDLDPGVRGRMSHMIQMWEKNEEQSYTISKVKRLQQDSDSGKIYRKYPVIDGVRYRLLKYQLPSQDLREAYEQKKAAYNRQLNEEMLEELLDDMDDEEDDGRVREPQAIADRILDEDRVEEYVQSNHGQLYIDRSLIEAEWDIGRSRSKTVKSLLKQTVDDDIM
jgi:hypothetical protein